MQLHMLCTEKNDSIHAAAWLVFNEPKRACHTLATSCGSHQVHDIGACLQSQALYRPTAARSYESTCPPGTCDRYLTSISWYITERYKIISQMFLITVGMIFPTLSGQNPWQYSRNSWKFKTHLFHEQLTASCWKTSISFAIPWSLPVPACTSNTKFQTSLTIVLLVFVASFRWIAYRILHL